MKLFHGSLFSIILFTSLATSASAEYFYPANNQSKSRLFPSERLGLYLNGETQRAGVRLIEWQEYLAEVGQAQDGLRSQQELINSISPNRLVYEVTRVYHHKVRGKKAYYLEIYDAETGKGLTQSGKRLARVCDEIHFQRIEDRNAVCR